jgi:hypothetical protein
MLPAHYLSLSPDEVEKLLQATPDLGVIDVRDDHEIRDGSGWIKAAASLSQLQAIVTSSPISTVAVPGQSTAPSADVPN